jgi:hypothetical protein
MLKHAWKTALFWVQQGAGVFLCNNAQNLKVKMMQKCGILLVIALEMIKLDNFCSRGNTKKTFELITFSQKLLPLLFFFEPVQFQNAKRLTTQAHTMQKSGNNHESEQRRAAEYNW